MLPDLTLRQLSWSDLRLIEPWFDDAETQRYLGDRSWPARMLALGERNVGSTFRGQRTLAAYRWLAWCNGTPVGYVDCGVLDRWTICDRGPGGPVVTEAISGPAGAIAFVVDPRLRRQHVGRAMLHALLAHPALADVRLFGAGVSPENQGSRRCLEAAGFRLHSVEPDWEGMLYYLFERVARSRPAADLSTTDEGSCPRRPERPLS